jgi:acetoacetate decarboxylase
VVSPDAGFAKKARLFAHRLDVPLAIAGKMRRGHEERVEIVEIIGDVAGPLPVPEPHPAAQWWYKFMPAVSGSGFDGDPLLVRYDQVRTPVTVEGVEGKLVLRDLPGTPVADLPVLEQESIRYMMTSSEYRHELADVAIDPNAYARHVAVQYS